MKTLAPLDTLFDVSTGEDLPLPATLAELYGRLCLTLAGESYVMGNFVSTLDGITALEDPTLSSGGAISGFNRHDRMVMGLLRAAADALVVGAGTVHADGHGVWAAESIFPDLAAEYQQLRRAMGKAGPLLNVFVSARGTIDFGLGVFRSSNVPILILTTEVGGERLRRQRVPENVTIEAVTGEERITAKAILEATLGVAGGRIVLVEGGPRLMADFLGERLMDELFLTIAPQVGGRLADSRRPGFVEGRIFLPGDPLWGRLISIKRADSHLLLRYAFSRA